jgi:hypothetical protein
MTEYVVHFTANVTVQAVDEEEAEEKAREMFGDLHGGDINLYLEEVNEA